LEIYKTNGDEMKIGVTGTRNGMTEYQYNNIRKGLTHLKRKHDELELHHGDCIGVDMQVANMARNLGIKVVSHPPIKEDLRAFHDSDIVLKSDNYLTRDRRIVDSVDMLLVVPKEDSFQQKSGTKYTHDYAKKTGKNKVIFYPNPKT
jgi:hypothetical protein